MAYGLLNGIWAGSSGDGGYPAWPPSPLFCPVGHLDSFLTAGALFCGAEIWPKGGEIDKKSGRFFFLDRSIVKRGGIVAVFDFFEKLLRFGVFEFVPLWGTATQPPQRWELVSRSESSVPLGSGAPARGVVSVPNWNG